MFSTGTNYLYAKCYYNSVVTELRIFEVTYCLDILASIYFVQTKILNTSVLLANRAINSLEPKANKKFKC